MTRLAVLGHPIAHSLSPTLHAAAYGVLGLDWEYGIVDVAESELAEFISTRDGSWRGLSLTMPLKRTVIGSLSVLDPLVELTGSANTVRFGAATEGTALSGYNTDVDGIVAAFGDVGVGSLETVQVLGGGATAASALVAVSRMGASRALVSVRTPERAQYLTELGSRVGVEVTIRNWLQQDRSLTVPDAVVSTLPGGSELPFAFPEAVRARSVLFDVAYDPWPSRLASDWGAADGTVVPGIRMLVHQALRQVRVFVNDSPDRRLEREPEVLAAMFAGVGLAPAVGGF